MVRRVLPVTQYGYLILGFTVLIGALMGALMFAVLRIATSARTASRDLRREGSETAFMAAAMQDAVNRLREQERVMKARAEASERLSSGIVTNLTSGLLLAGADGSILALNPAGRRLLNLADTTPLPRLHELGAHAAPLADVVQECLQTGGPIVRRSVKINPAGGQARHFGVTVSPVKDEDGHPQNAICLFTDLSAVMDLEEQLRLKDSLARLGEMTAGIAHEFRNSLGTIHGYSHLMDPTRLPNEYRPYLDGIRRETHALGEVVTNFLNFAKPTELVVTPVDLRATVDRAASEIRGDAENRGGDVVVRGEFGIVEGDDVLLRQAFSNLCRNALEACLAVERPPRIAIEGVVDRGHVRVAVLDNGPGIDAAHSDRIFRPFFTTKAAGTGLGLALVQKIIVTHNGRVTGRNEPAGGARFEVTLPLT
jgi:two-component system sensor histidine kinase HydH